MPKKLFFTADAEHPRSGIDVTWTRSAQRLDFGGWYDTYVGIEGHSMTLGEFFAALGISAKDCAKAFKEPPQ